jgi:hypothetical protein
MGEEKLAIKSELETSLDIVTPQTLKDNEAIDKLLELYFLNLRDQQEISEDPVNLLDANYLIKKIDEGATGVDYKDVKSELFKIHLDEIYKIFESVQDSDKIYEKYKEIYSTLNIPTDTLKVDFNLDDEINDEYITASNSYKTKKGTKAGFFFVNDIINKVNIDPLNSDPYFQIEEGLDGDLSVPYAYTVKTSLYKEVFQETILPLSHPVGFNWHFFRLLYLSLVDHFGLIETKTMTDLTLTCYSLDDEEDIRRQVLLKSSLDSSNVKTLKAGEFGSVKNFYIAKDQKDREQVIIDFYSTKPYPSDNTTQNGYRLLRDYDGRVVIFERQDEILYVNQDGEDEIINLELEKVELVDKRQGELEIFKRKKIILGQEVEVISGVRFKEYSIFDLKEVKLRYSFIGGTPLAQGEELTDENRQWNYSSLELKNKVISTDKKFFESVDFGRKEIIEGSGEQFYGRVIEDRGMNCKLTYKIDYTYEVTTSDVTGYVSNIRKAEALKQLNNPDYKDNDENTIQEFNQKETFDNWARLDPNNGVIEIDDLIVLSKIGSFPIAGVNPINAMDKGIDDFLGVDADIHSTYETTDYQGLPVKLDPGKVNDERVWRNEAYFKPSTYKDLSDLDKASEQNGHTIFEITASPAIYERENIGNETYAAHELKSVNETILMTHNEIAIDPVLSATEHMIDANGSDRGVFLGYAFIGEGGLNTNSGFSTDYIGDAVIGGYTDENNNNNICVNPYEHIYRLETRVNADPVNLQLNTFDCESSNFEYNGKWDNDNVNLTGDSRGEQGTHKTNEDGSDSFADEKNTTDITYAPYTDDYNYEQPDYDIGELDTIGRFYIKGPIKDKLFDETETVITYIEMNRETTLEYNNFTNDTEDIGEFIINDGSELGGHIYSETGTFEIYQAVWNTHEWDSDNITSFVYGYTEGDNVNKIGDIRNNGNDDNIYEQDNGKRDSYDNPIIEGVFAVEKNVTDITYAPYEDRYEYEQHDFSIDDLETIGSFLIEGLHRPITEDDSEDHFINMNRSPEFDYAPGFDWKSLYAVNNHLNQSNEDDTIGDSLYIGGEVTYDFGDVNGYADPVNLNATATDPSIFNIRFGNIGGETEDPRENEVSLHWVGDSETGSWENYKTQFDGFNNVPTFVKEEGGFENKLEHSELGAIYRDYWEIEEQNYNIGSDDEATYVGGIPRPIKESTLDTITWNFTIGNLYRYPTYVDLMATGDNDTIGEGYIGGSLTHDEFVDAEIYEDIYTDTEETHDNIAPSITEYGNYRYIDGEKEIIRQLINEETGETGATIAQDGIDYSIMSDTADIEYYKYRNYDTELNNFEIGDGSYVGGELSDVNDEEMGVHLKSTTIHFKVFSNQIYVYNTFINSLDDTETIGEGYIGGELYEERVDADVYQAEWNTHEKDTDNIEQINEEKRIEERVNDYTQPANETDGTTETVFAEEKHNTVQTHKATFDEYNLRNADTLIGQGMVIGGTLDDSDDGQILYIGGELVNIIDEDKVNAQILMGNNSNTELVVDSALYIGEGTIGDSYIKARLATYTRRDEESYMNVGDFDIFSDEDSWEMGVWKNDGDGNYVLLEDNNVSAAS